MDITTILSALGLGSLGGKTAWVIGIISSIYAFYTSHKDKIQAIILRIEKERTDENGWTPKEKEQLVLDVFFAEIYPTFPAWIRIIPFVKPIISKIIKNIISKFCKKSSAIKEPVKAVISLG